jgi:hypothetical protein
MGTNGWKVNEWKSWLAWRRHQGSRCRLRSGLGSYCKSNRRAVRSFKWIKQHLWIKAFFGETENAVKTQIWSAVCVYVLVAIVKKRLFIKASLYEMLQILNLTLFEKAHLLSLFVDIPAKIPIPLRITNLIYWHAYGALAIPRSVAEQVAPS